MQRMGGEDVVDAQAATRLVLEATAAIIEPAEAIDHLRIEGAEAVLQAPAFDPLQPLALLRQEAALAGAQPALGIHLADADVAILRRDIEVTHQRQRFVRTETLFEQGLQIGIELGLGGKLHRMGAAFALGEVAVHDGDRLAVCIGETAPDETLLRLLAVAGKALVNFQRRLAREQGDPVVTFLSVIVDVIAEGLDLRLRELLVGHLGFLQADDVRLMLVDDRRKLVRSGP